MTRKEVKVWEYSTGWLLVHVFEFLTSCRSQRSFNLTLSRMLTILIISIEWLALQLCTLRVSSSIVLSAFRWCSWWCESQQQQQKKKSRITIKPNKIFEEPRVAIVVRSVGLLICQKLWSIEFCSSIVYTFHAKTSRQTQKKVTAAASLIKNLFPPRRGLEMRLKKRRACRPERFF